MTSKTHSPRLDTKRDAMSKSRLADLSRFRLDFGTHQGKTLREVPPDYLDWITKNIHDATIRWLVKQYQNERRQHPRNRKHKKRGRTSAPQAQSANQSVQGTTEPSDKPQSNGGENATLTQCHETR